MPDLDRWQRADGFPATPYFQAVANALAAAGVDLETWHNDELWESAFIVDRNLIDRAGGGTFDNPRQQAGMFAAWRCGQDDEPTNADNFTGEGWFWCPCVDADGPGDRVVSLDLPYLAEPVQVAAAVVEVLRDNYGQMVAER